MIKLAIVEDNAFSLRAMEDKLSQYPHIELRFTAGDGQEAISLLMKNSEIDIILMDIDMPLMNGIEATAIIKEKFPAIKIVIITIYDNDEFIFQAIKAGADSYILKDSKGEKVYETITDTLNGGAVMSPSIALKTLKFLKTAKAASLTMPAGSGSLSERELSILEQVGKGLTNKKIADVLFISPFTVKRHIENIYKKLQAGSRVEVVEKARRKGLL